MWKKKRAAAPYFKTPPVYNPVTGERAPLGDTASLTRIAMAQVTESDSHDNYVVCRLFDPEFGKLLKSVNVAKPYSLRGTNPYVVGQVFAAAKPRTALGDTPGMAETSVGQPADLDEKVVILTDDDDGYPIAWLDISGGSSNSLIPYIPSDDVAPGDEDIEAYAVKDDLTADTDSDTILIQNKFPGLYRGLGADHSEFTPSPVAIVFTEVMPDGNPHIAFGLGQAKMIRCQAKMSGSEKTLATVDHITPMDGGQNPVADSTSATLTMTYDGTWETDNGAWGVATWDEAADVWRPLEFPCKT